MSDHKEIKNDIQFDREVSNWNVRDELKGKSVEEILEHQPKRGFAVGLVNIDGGLNIGSMIRTATIFGADCVYIIGRKRFDRRSTVGAHNYIEIKHIDEDQNTETGANNILTAIKGDEYIPCSIEQGGRPIDNLDMMYVLPDGRNCWSPLRYKMRPCFLFGAEKEGLSSFITSNTGIHSIRQFGVLRSLNVSSAAAIVMYEYNRGFK